MLRLTEQLVYRLSRLEKFERRGVIVSVVHVTDRHIRHVLHVLVYFKFLPFPIA